MATADRLGLVAFLVRDYDEAIAWFRDVLEWELVEDSDHGGGKRWVRMAPSAQAPTQFLLARAVGAQVTGLGRHAAGRVGYFLYTDDFATRHAHMLAKGTLFEEAPRQEAYGTVAVFRDLYGNRWDLIEPAKAG